MSTIRTVSTIALSSLIFASVAPASIAGGSGETDRIFETSVTKDMNMFSGEPEITIDPQNPRNLAVIEFTLGSDKRPAWEFNPLSGAPTLEDADESMSHLARVDTSNDGGKTWHARPAPAFDPNHTHAPGGGDPMIAAGPDGSLYAADEPFPRSPGQRGTMSEFAYVIAYSGDWGKTFAPPVFVPTPVDRPFIKVDQSTGMVYSASTGYMNPETGVMGKPGNGAIMDRWLVAWKPHLAAHSEPRRMGGPDFSATAGTSHIAANGVVASTFVIGAPFPGMGPVSAAPSPVPASLKSAGAPQTCSFSDPCLFFQTSSDDGLHWSRHYIPVPGGFSGFLVYIAADEGRPGRYAVGMLNKDSTGLKVVTTDDAGVTWSQPSTVVQVAQTMSPEDTTKPTSPLMAMMLKMRQSMIFKPWMAYSPTGVLGFMWKQKRDDIAGPPQPPQSPLVNWGPGFDVYAAISCDGGTTWLPPARVNARTSPNGPSGQDDLSYAALDKSYMHLIWGDRRDIMKIKNVPTGQGGVQAYYGRVPYSVVSKGAQCGRE